MPRKENQKEENYYDHYVDNRKPNETANAVELARFYNKNSTMPIDVSKFDK